MALRTYLTGIADAIRTKKGTNDPINAKNFASEIESIESGGGDWTQEPVYSGTITLTAVGSVSGSIYYYSSDKAIKKTSWSSGSTTLNISNSSMIFLTITAPSVDIDVNNAEILREFGFNYTIKPTAENWTITINTQD